MSQVAFIVNAPKFTAGKFSIVDFIDVGNELVRQIRNNLGDAQATLAQVALADTALIAQTYDVVATGATSSPLNTKTGGHTKATIAGAAAGNLTVTGIKKASNRLIAVVKVDDTTHAGVDLTAEFTITADNTINNTGRTASTGAHVVVVWA